MNTGDWRWLSEALPEDGEIFLIKREINKELLIDVCRRENDEIWQLSIQRAYGHNIKGSNLLNCIAWKPIPRDLLDGWPDREETEQ